jgi:hypothetical protein
MRAKTQYDQNYSYESQMSKANNYTQNINDKKKANSI